MTYLQMVQRLARECGVAKTTTAPSTVTGQTGELARLCDYIAQAWLEIQMERNDWEWMRETATFTTTASQQTYTLANIETATTSSFTAAAFGWWKPDSFRVYLTSSGVQNETLMDHMEYDTFRNYYLLGSRKSAFARPVAVAVTPGKGLSFGLGPDADYTVAGEFYHTPTALSSDSDEPDFNARYHMLVVFRGMRQYAEYESAPEVFARAERGYTLLYNRLLADQAQAKRLGGSLF